jgi:hypothetical protein
MKPEKTHQVHHILLKTITPSSTVSDYIVSTAKQHVPGRKKLVQACCWPSICNTITCTVNKEHSLHIIWLPTKFSNEGEIPSKDDSTLTGCEYSSVSSFSGLHYFKKDTILTLLNQINKTKSHIITSILIFSSIIILGPQGVYSFKLFSQTYYAFLTLPVYLHRSQFILPDLVTEIF